MNMTKRSQENRCLSSALRRFRYRLTSSKLRSPILWLRHRGLRASDVFLGSYPRSGSTWLRFNLYEILTGQTATFESVNSGMRGPGNHYLGTPVLPGNGRVLGTHEPYRLEYEKAIYLVRDIRDVVTSEYWYENKRGFGYDDFDEYIVQMLDSQRKYGSWQNHVASWISSPTAKNGNLLLIRYEDMRQNPEATLNWILEFLGVQKDPAAITQAVANNALQRMREKENTLHKMPQRLNYPERAIRNLEEESRFVRSGLVAGWRQQLSESQVKLIEKHAGTILKELGYPLARQSPSLCPL